MGREDEEPESKDELDTPIVPVVLHQWVAIKELDRFVSSGGSTSE